MTNIGNYCTYYYVACMGFWRIHTFFINVHALSYIPCPTNKNLVNQDGEPTTPYKLETGTKTSVSNICALLCPCVVQKETEYVDTKTLNIRHQP